VLFRAGAAGMYQLEARANNGLLFGGMGVRVR
jgi:hypothetical protein